MKKEEDNFIGLRAATFFQVFFQKLVVYIGSLLVLFATVGLIGFFARDKEDDTLE